MIAAILLADGLHSAVLKDCHLAVSAGEIVTLRGASGSGKTLLLRAIADLDPHGGEVWLDGLERSAMTGPEWRRRVRFVAAEAAWWAEGSGHSAIVITPRARWHDGNPIRESPQDQRSKRTAHKGRIHDRSRLQCRNVKNALAERGPSIHDEGRWFELIGKCSSRTRTAIRLAKVRPLRS
jgi:ABC-type sugar transport system ATPase subunit